MRLRTFALIGLVLVLIGPLYVGGQVRRSSRSDMTIFRRIDTFPIRADHTREQRQRLAPNPEDIRSYGSLLESGRAGIFRIMPDLGCYDNENIIRADEDCINAIPESSFYSFREKEHTIEPLADIRLQNGFLVSDGLLAQGIMVRLGDVRPDHVTLDTPGVEFLRSYEPPVNTADAQQHFVQFVRGVRLGGFEYRKAVKAGVGATYALRIVAYRGNVFRSFRGYRFDLLAGDKRTDLLIAFRVVRRDEDGSLTLVWRELERRDAPRLRIQRKKKGEENAKSNQ